MTEPMASQSPASAEKSEVSLVALASVLVRWSRPIIALAVAGGVIALSSSILTERVYASRATFLTQASEQATSNLALAANQFGLQLPPTSTAWGPLMYIELLRSRVLLEPLGRDTVVVAEEGGRRLPVMDLLEIEAPSGSRRLDLTVKALQNMVESGEVKSLGAVHLSVKTKWPSVSLQLAQKLVSGLNQFNLETRQSQAAQERRFVEERTAEAEAALRSTEEEFAGFLQRNRVIAGAPGLELQRDRLQRDLTIRQEIYTSLLQKREEARIREVRDTPVITILEEPRLPLLPEARNSLYKGFLGSVLGAMAGITLALAVYLYDKARASRSPEMLEFFRVLDQAKPRFLRRNQ